MANLRCKLIFIFLFSVLSLGNGAVAQSLSNSGGGSWQYQKDITISNTGGTLNDYQVLVSLTGGDFPTNAQTSGADIRFTDASGAELSYWIENWDYSGRTAKIWVKVPSISAGATTTIRMYYGNPSATSMSNGDGTFVFFDDFSGAVLSSKWTNSVSPEGRGSVTVSNGMLNLIANPTPGPSGTWSVGEFAQVKSTASFPLPYKLVFRYYTNLPYPFTYIDTGLPGKAECYHLGGMSDYPATAIQPATDNGGVSNGIIHMYSQNAGNPRLLTISTSTTTRTNFDLQPNVFKTFEYRADSSSVKFVSDGTVIASHSTNIPITPLPIMFEASQSRSGYSRCGYYDITIPSEYHVDYVFLAKYTSSEPSISIGAQTPAITATPTTFTPTPTTPTPTPTLTPTPMPTATAILTPIIKATISIYGISPSYNSGDTLGANVVVTNIGSKPPYIVVFDIRKPNGKWENLYRKFMDFIEQGESQEYYFSYDIPISGPAGLWTFRAELYDGWQERRYDFKEQTFTVSVPAQTTLQTTLTPTTLPAGAPIATVTPKSWQENILVYILISVIIGVLSKIIYDLIR